MFFQSINTMMGAGTDLSINIRKVGDGLVVSTLPRNNNLKDGSQSYLIPLTVSGTPMELDAGYLQAIMQPIQKAAGLLINLEQFEKQAEKAASTAKSQKAKTDNGTNEGKDKRENYDKCLKKADELAAAKQLSEALTYLKQAKTFATPIQQTELSKKIRMTEQELSQGSLFEVVEEPQIQSSGPMTMQPQSQQPMSRQAPAPQQPMPQPRQTGQPAQTQPMQPRPMAQPGQQARQPMQQQPMSRQPLQQPVIHPAQFMTTNGQPLTTSPAEGIPAGQPYFRQESGQYQPPVMTVQRQQPATQPEYDSSFWNGKDEEQEANCFREDPYAGYPDFPEECRMLDQAQAAVY